MHEYTQDILRRLMGRSKKPAYWTEDNVRRFAEFCYKKAPSCKCGCGKKTIPGTGRKPKLNIKQCFAKFHNQGLTPEFPEFYGSHSRLISFEIDDELEQNIIAARIGDGYISHGNSKSKGCRIAWNMGNEDHAKHKREKFDAIGAVYKEKENPGFGDRWHCVVTKTSILLNKYKEMSYSDCAKKMNAIGWAIYYGDDGHLDKKNQTCFLHTEGKSLDEVENIVLYLNEFIGSDSAKIHSYIGGTKKRLMHCIRINKNGSKEFMQRIAPHMERGVEYKNVYCS